MDMQKLFDSIIATHRDDRSRYHLTLGPLVKMLEIADPNAPVAFDCGGAPSHPHSYRGYYSDLAFETQDKISAGEFLTMCRAALGNTFEGYKGGDFLMGPETPLWSAFYGSSGGRAIMNVTVRPESVVLATKEIE